MGSAVGCLVGLAVLSPAANAALTHTVSLDGKTFSAFFVDAMSVSYVYGKDLPNPQPFYFPANSVLLEVAVDAVLVDYDGPAPTYANDISVYLGAEPYAYPRSAPTFLTGGRLQIGDGNTTGSTTHLQWNDGASSVIGTPVVDTKTTADFGSGIDLSKWNVWVGHGYGSGAVGEWSGTITFTYEIIPEPHHYAIGAGLGLLGFAAYRRFARR